MFRRMKGWKRKYESLNHLEEEEIHATVWSEGWEADLHVCYGWWAREEEKREKQPEANKQEKEVGIFPILRE